MKRRTKITKTYNLLIQVAILVLTYIFIYRQVFVKTDLPQVISVLKADFSTPWVFALLLLVLFMMLLNWAIEAVKWSLMIRKIERVGFWKSVQAVLSGVAISSFTPNRVGEFFGRAYILNRASHIEGILVTILGSMSQLLVTFLAGSVSLILLMPRFFPDMPTGYLYDLVTILVLLLDLLLLALFLNASFISNVRKKIFPSGLKHLRRFVRVFGLFSRKELVQVLGLSFARYLVFSTQFFLILVIFRVPINWFSAILVISLIYLLMSLIPTIALTELGIRGSVSVYCFSLWFLSRDIPADLYSFGILSASVLLWLINLGIPAVVGTIFVFRLQFFRKGGPKKD